MFCSRMPQPRAPTLLPSKQLRDDLRAWYGLQAWFEAELKAGDLTKGLLKGLMESAAMSLAAGEVSEGEKRS